MNLKMNYVLEKRIYREGDKILQLKNMKFEDNVFKWRYWDISRNLL